MKSLQHPIHTPLLQYFSTDFPWILTLSLLSIECTLPRTLHIPGSLQVKNWKLIYHDENCQHPKLRGQYLYRIYTTHFPTISHGKYHHIVIQSFYIMVCVLKTVIVLSKLLSQSRLYNIDSSWARAHMYTCDAYIRLRYLHLLHLHVHLHLHYIYICTYIYCMYILHVHLHLHFGVHLHLLHLYLHLNHLHYIALYIYIYVCVYVCVYPVHYLIFLGFQFQSSCFLPVLHHGPWRFSVLSFLPPSASSILFPHARAATDVLATSTAEYFSKTQRQDSTAATTLSHSNSRTI